MKKLTMKAMALGMAASFVLFGMTACTSTTVDEPSQSSDESIEIGGATSGGWTVEDGDIIDDDLVVFDNAMEGLLGVDYTPIALVATQVVSGRNYCFLAKATPVVQDPVSYYTFVYIYEDLEGNSSVTNIANCPLPGGATSGDEVVPGGWEFVDADGLPMDADALIAEATEELTGAGYQAYAVIGAQTANGQNFAVLCKTTAVVPDAVPTVTLVKVVPGDNDRYQLGDVTDIDIGSMASAQPET